MSIFSSKLDKIKMNKIVNNTTTYIGTVKLELSNSTLISPTNIFS